MHKLRQDVAAHLFAHHKTACLLTLSPLACHEAACSEPVKRRFNAWSGRRGSNPRQPARSEEHTSELQSQSNLVCRLLLEKKKTTDLTSRMPQATSPVLP